MNYILQIITVGLITLVFSACESKEDAPAGNEIIISQSAFNKYDTTTFSKSTCENLPLEVPIGIFVSTSGKSTAAGTEVDPLDLATALSNSSPAQAGDTIWIKEGIYKGNFVSDLRGADGNPIKVKPFPGERVILDGNVDNVDDVAIADSLTIQGNWTNYYGLETTSSATNHTAEDPGSNPSDLTTNGGINIHGANTKLINSLSYDNVATGIGSWSDAVDSELYGNIIYNNGWTSDRGHGHGIYMQNNAGSFKKLTNNILFFGYGLGMHAYTEGGQLNGFDVQYNTWFMSGSSDPRSSAKKDNLLIGGLQPVLNLTMKHNQGFSMNTRGTRLGYSDSVTGQTGIVEDNYLSENFWTVGSWDSLPVSNTTVLRGLTGSASTYIQDGNNGNIVKGTPDIEAPKIFLKANDYDARRAKLVIYNTQENESVDVDLGSILKMGEAYRIHSVFALFDAPMMTGVYDGNTISVPMGSIEPPQPTGTTNIAEEDDPHRKFGVFIITHGGCS